MTLASRYSFSYWSIGASLSGLAFAIICDRCCCVGRGLDIYGLALLPANQPPSPKLIRLDACTVSESKWLDFLTEFKTFILSIFLAAKTFSKRECADMLSAAVMFIEKQAVVPAAND